MEVQVHLEFVDARSGQALVSRRSVGQVQESGVDILMFEDEGEESQAFSASKLKRSLYKAFLDSIPTMQKANAKLDWMGRVARIEGERIFINAGKKTGLGRGDTLKVLEEGNDVFDPVSGKLIGKAPGRVKGTIRVLNFFGEDGSVAIVESGGSFSEGDRIELY